jgi:hypothetical protein
VASEEQAEGSGPAVTVLVFVPNRTAVVEDDEPSVRVGIRGL